MSERVAPQRVFKELLTLISGHWSKILAFLTGETGAITNRFWFEYLPLPDDLTIKAIGLFSPLFSVMAVAIVVVSVAELKHCPRRWRRMTFLGILILAIVGMFCSAKLFYHFEFAWKVPGSDADMIRGWYVPASYGTLFGSISLFVAATFALAGDLVETARSRARDAAFPVSDLTPKLEPQPASPHDQDDPLSED